MTSHVSDRYNDIFVGDGEMAQMMRLHNWAESSVGPPETWPEALKVAIRLLLTSKFEMWLGWGPDIAFFYNDAYRPTLGGKHAEYGYYVVLVVILSLCAILYFRFKRTGWL